MNQNPRIGHQLGPIPEPAEGSSRGTEPRESWRTADSGRKREKLAGNMARVEDLPRHPHDD